MKSVKWGEFKLGNLFDIENTLSFNADRLNYGTEYDYVTRTSFNQGILQTTGFVNKENINESGVWSLGLLQMDFFFRRKKWYAGQFVRKIIPKFDLSENSILFFSTILNQQKKILSSVLVRNVDETFKTLKIKLPITEEKEIDFDFMESFIRELEEERIRELEEERIRELNAYLLATNLKEYALSSEEENALKEFESLDNWEEYAFKNIFNNIKQGRRLKKEDQKNGNIPFVMSGTTNTGVVGYISNPVASFPSNSITVDIFGNTFYRNYAFGAGDDTGVYWNDKEKYSKDEMLFFTTSMGKSLFGKFDYGNKLRSSQSFDITMKLPTKNDAPDYSFMETFINAVEKLVIKDVVLYADEKIKRTKDLISHKSTEYTYDDNSGLLNVAQPPR